jgi:tetratricopeptide (TPR) repeat protein/DNA-binding CsgD family transcriptional regulator
MKPLSFYLFIMIAYLPGLFAGNGKGGQDSPDSALYYLNLELNRAEKTGSPKDLYAIYERYGQVFSNSGNFPIALDYQFKMLGILDDEASEKHDTVSLLKRYAGLYAQIGTSYFNIDRNSEALAYYRKSFEVVQKLARLDRSYPADAKYIVLYTNIGSACLSSYNFVEAKRNFEKALELNKPLNNPAYDASLFNNLGIVYKENKEYEKAFEYYHRSLGIRYSLNDTSAIAQTYNNLGDACYLTGDYKKAIEYLDKAMQMSRQTGSIRSQMKAANFLSLAYEKVGSYAKALEMHKTFKSLHDSIISNDLVQQTARLELQYQYEKQRKEVELRQEILIAKKERKALIYMILSGVLLFSFVILFLLNRNQRMRMKQVELELDFRNKELSTHVMYLLRKNEFISSIINKMLAIKRAADNPQNDVWIEEILREMQSNVDNTVWTEFEKRFQQVHKDFYKKLLEKYPDLTPNEIKICAFLKLNMTTKDISAITFQSVKSIQVARNRLRKRMGISRDENLVSAIQQL